MKTETLAKTSAPAARAVEKSTGLASAYWLSGLLALVTLVTAAISFLSPAIFHRDHPALTGCVQGTALVMLVIGVPMLILAMLRAARGSVRAIVFWLAAIYYLLYNSVYLAFGTTFNSLFLLFVAALALAIWSLVALLSHLNIQEMRAAFGPKMPVRIVALFTLLPLLEYLGIDILPAIQGMLSGNLPANLAGTQLPSNPFWIMDLAVTVPPLVLGAVWLWQRKTWGYLLVGALLTYFSIELVSVASDQYFGTLAFSNAPDLASTVIIPVLAGLFLVQLVPLSLFFRHVRGAGRSN